MEKPEGLEEEHLEFLDELRKDGCTNMYGAAPYLVEDFGLPIKVAQEYLKYWMETFSQRHGGDEQ